MPVKQEVEAFSLKEDGEMNASDLQSYYADMPELQFHQMMQDMDFFAQEFSDPIFGFVDTFDTLIRDYSGDPESEIHARTSIQSAELAESEWLYNIGLGESCAVPFEFLLVGRQTSRESGEIPPDQQIRDQCESAWWTTSSRKRSTVKKFI